MYRYLKKNVRECYKSTYGLLFFALLDQVQAAKTIFIYYAALPPVCTVHVGLSAIGHKDNKRKSISKYGARKCG